MTTWRPSPSLVRACLLALGGIAGGVVLGLEVLVVLAAPFVVLAGMGLMARPRQTPAVNTRIDHHRLHEGQGTVSRLAVAEVTDVEHVTRVASPAAHVAARPTYGTVGSLVVDGLPTIEFSPRRWGRREIGAERVVLTSAWAGWRWGPVGMPEHELTVLPQTAAYDSRAEVPQPDGLVGRHRSRRLGSGTEFEGIRQFATGDRLEADQLAGLAAHRRAARDRHTRRAGRRSLAGRRRPAGHRRLGWHRRCRQLPRPHGACRGRPRRAPRPDGRPGGPAGGGRRRCARTPRRGTETPPEAPGHARPGADGDADRASGADRPGRRRSAGSVVYVLSPMLFTPLVTATASLQRSGASVIVIDTLPGERVVTTDSRCPAWRRGCRRSSATTGSSGSPRSVARWCRGGAPEPSTPSCTSSRDARRVPKVRAR